jgi:hypothetical protein
MTVLDLITRSLRVIGWLRIGELPSNDVAQGVLGIANSLLQSFNLDRNKIFTISRTVYTMPAAQKTFSIGPGAEFNSDRPNEITAANLLLQTSPAYRIPLDLLNEEQYAAITVPDIVSIPRKIWYQTNFKQTAPIGSGLIYFWPVPNGIYQVELFASQNLPALVLLTDTLKYPDGYERMIVNNLAVEIAPEFGRQVTPELAAIAVASMEAVVSKNAPSPILGTDPAISPRRRSNFNYLTGEPT